MGPNMKQLYCAPCSQFFPTKRDLQLHNSREHLWTRVVVYECHICQKRCDSKEGVIKHIIEVHFPQNAPKDEESSAIQTKKPPPGPGPSCPMCPQAFTDQPSLKQHIKELHVDRGKQKPASKKRKAAAEEGQPLDCPLCGFRTLDSVSLQEHIASSHLKQRSSKDEEAADESREQQDENDDDGDNDTKTWLCVECGESFPDEDGLQRHVDREHAGSGEGANCPVCGLACSGKEDLREHITARHLQAEEENGEKQLHECPLCGQGLQDQRQLRMHVRNAHLQRNKQSNTINNS